VFPWKHYISELSVAPGGADVVFGAMIAGMALLTGWFFYRAPSYFAGTFDDSLSQVRLARVFGLLGSAVLIAMIFVPLNPSVPSLHTAHLILATVVFGCMTVYTGAYGFSFGRRGGVFAAARTVAILTAVGALAVVVFTILTDLSHVLNPAPVIFLTEWITFALFSVWLLFLGLALIRVGSKSAEPHTLSREDTRSGVAG